MTLNMQSTMIFAHRANIERYRRLLKSRLTDHERKYVERRLGEEKKALLELGQGCAPVDYANTAQIEPSHAASVTRT